jgi:surfeit locus 1 family protein
MKNKEILKWTLTTILVLIGLYVLIRLGFWQLDRLESRRQFNQHYLVQMSSPIINLNDEINHNELLNMEYREVTVSGYYDFSNEIYLQNQAYENIPGYRVVTPLKIDSNDNFVYIERGWISLEDFKDRDDINSHYTQHQNLEGIIRLPQSESDFGGKSSNISDPNSQFFLYVDLDLFTTKLEYELLPIYVQLKDENNYQKPYSKLAEIEITEGPHFGYAVQWFFFASLLGIGYPFFVRKQIWGEKNRSRE